MANKKSLSNAINKAHADSSRATPPTEQFITKDKIRKLLPKNTSIAVTDEVIALISTMENDSGLPQEMLEEDVMSYMHLLGNTKGSNVIDLINAIKYCNLKRNYTNKEAWSIVFPVKYKNLTDNNKQVDSHVSMYNGGKLITMVDTEMLIPVSLQYAPYFHSAVQELYNIGVKGKGGKDTRGQEMNVTPMVKVQALKELVMITKPPEEQKLAISVTPSAAALDMQSDMNDQLKSIVAHQRARLESGEDYTDVQVIGLDFSEIGKDVD